MSTVYSRLAQALKNDWRAKARKEQLAPVGDWAIWLLLADVPSARPGPLQSISVRLRTVGA